MIKRKRPLNKVNKKKKQVKKAKITSINRKRKNNYKYLPDIIEKRFVLITIIILVLFSIISFRLFKLQILDNKKYRDLTNTFLIEGEHLVKEAKKNNLIKTIIVLEDFQYETDLNKVIVTKEVMKKLSDNPSIPKIMAIVYKKECTRIGNKVLILDRLQDPGNLGTIIRSATAFDFDTLILSDDTVDLYNSKVIRSTQGMLFNINIKRCNIYEEITKLKEKDYLILGTKVDGGTDVKNYTINKKFALIIGNEGQGISNNILDLCEDYLYINMNNKCESLNAGVAASILMYELGGKNEIH